LGCKSRGAGKRNRKIGESRKNLTQLFHKKKNSLQNVLFQNEQVGGIAIEKVNGDAVSETASMKSQSEVDEAK
jgi:hypothetical protein